MGIGLPLTILAGALVDHLLFDDWPSAQALLLAAVLVPTDAALAALFSPTRAFRHVTESH
jgi:NhaP-type Na+/H+ or K+/H+ antiporter